MTEHNLPDKDDAPWLDTTYDGFEFNIDTSLDDIEMSNGDFIKSYPDVTRVEVIGSDGREYVRYECSNVQVSLQDDGQTIKVFLASTYD